MTKREIASLICKVLAITTIIWSINLIPPVYSLLLPLFTGNPIGSSRDLILYAVIYSLPIVFSMLAALYLWFRSDDMAGLMVKDADTEVEPPVIGAEAQTLVFTGLAIHTLLGAIPYALKSVATYIYLTVQSPATNTGSFGNTPLEAFSSFARIGLGLWLLFGASGLVRLLSRMREISQRSKENLEG